jgi:hypothetical protein
MKIFLGGVKLQEKNAIIILTINVAQRNGLIQTRHVTIAIIIVDMKMLVVIKCKFFVFLILSI